MNKITCFLILFFASTISFAQNFPYGKASKQEMEMQKYDKDTTANAVVLNEFGKAQVNSSASQTELVYEYHVKIKIFNARGFSNGTVELPLRNTEDNESGEGINNISGITSYKDDNGVTQVAELDPKTVYTTREYKYQRTLKFAMPGLRDGCVIEYRYILTSPFLEHFHTWMFQGEIPKIYSEFDAMIPEFISYNIALRGPLPLLKNQSDAETNRFAASRISSGSLKLAYAMKDIPAFIKEEYMTAPKNFMAALHFDLVEYTNPNTGAKNRVTTEWKDVDYQLKDNERFGQQLKKTALVKEHMPASLLTITDSTEKAKAIFKWVQAYFKWDNYVGIYSIDGVKKAIDSHSGSDADINLTLVDALNAAGINAGTVLLSTRDNGMINKLYPIMDDFNYVIALINIGGDSYFLDATDPLLPFGVLPVKCLNGQGRAYSLDKPSYWINLDTQQKQLSTYDLDFTLQEDGKLKGNVMHYSIGYDAYLKRKEIKQFNTSDEYIEDLNSKSTKVKVLKAKIANLDSVDQPLVERYAMEIVLTGKNNENNLAFNPYFWGQLVNNPFKLAERSYPVDLGMPSNHRLNLTIHLPDDYSVDTPPQNIGIAMPDKGGTFITSYQPGDSMFTYSYQILLNKAVYNSAEYPYLKEFFNRIIQSEKAEIIFKKK